MLDGSAVLGRAYNIYQLEIAMKEPSRQSCDFTHRHDVKEAVQQLSNHACSSTKAANLKISQQGHRRQITSQESKITETNKTTCLQEAENGQGSYRPSILDEYQDNRKKHPISHSHASDCNQQHPSHSEESQESPRLTRFSDIQSNKSKLKTTTISILQMLENAAENRRCSLINNFKSAIKQLSKGVLLQKYCYNRFKVETVILTFSEDFQFMSLFGLQKSQTKVYSMKLFPNVLKGLKTHRFYEYQERGYKLKQDECFSLNFQERSFDFSAEDKESCDELVSNINFILQSK